MEAYLYLVVNYYAGTKNIGSHLSGLIGVGFMYRVLGATTTVTYLESVSL